MLNFEVFKEYLDQEKLEEAKSLVTKANAQARDSKSGYGVLFHLCFHGPDDTDLLYHFVELGATLELDNAGKRMSPLHAAAWRGNSRQLRALLDLGVNVDIFCRSKCTPLYHSVRHNQKEHIRMLLDTGARLDLLKEDVYFKIPAWIYKFISKREQIRESSVIILGLLRCKSKVTGKNGKDVLKIIARCAWRLRGL